MLPPEQLAAVFEANGIDLSLKRPLIASCGSGVTASILILALDQLGVQAIATHTRPDHPKARSSHLSHRVA